ncbi:zinc ribbon domain-containing protein [Sinosporangium album]|uniref:zinc ribbon domain-containing protein n=1 Tax=Sinosporangium album TaxID=504805 RepID=UPI001160077F|nr:zinc ribbon domain-containing protein [Sinosporangium album]
MSRRANGEYSQRPHLYAFRGILFCGYCQRRMQGNWNNKQPYSRCLFPREYALVNQLDHPKVVYLREAEIISEVDGWLAEVFRPESLERTIAAMAEQARDPGEAARVDLRKRLAQCDRKINRYRAALDAGGDPVEVSGWINEAKGERARLEGELRAVPAVRQVTEKEIGGMLEHAGDLVEMINAADGQDKADLYAQLGLTLTYYPEKQYVEARIEPEPPHVRAVCVRGGT